MGKGKDKQCFVLWLRKKSFLLATYRKKNSTDIPSKEGQSIRDVFGKSNLFLVSTCCPVQWSCCTGTHCQMSDKSKWVLHCCVFLLSQEWRHHPLLLMPAGHLRGREADPIHDSEKVTDCNLFVMHECKELNSNYHMHLNNMHRINSLCVGRWNGRNWSWVGCSERITFDKLGLCM